MHINQMCVLLFFPLFSTVSCKVIQPNLDPDYINVNINSNRYYFSHSVVKKNSHLEATTKEASDYILQSEDGNTNGNGNKGSFTGIDYGNRHVGYGYDYGDGYSDKYITCDINEDCKSKFPNHPTECSDGYCMSLPSELPCEKDYECAKGSLCEDWTCRYVYCNEEKDCREERDVGCDVHKHMCIGQGIIQHPINGGWSDWRQWSKTSGDAFLTRKRTCTNPAPQNGGAKCIGKSFEIKKEIVNGGWSNWGQWSKTGGNSFFTRERTCTNPTPQNGGAKCEGKSIEIKKEVVNGGWSNWGQWSKSGENVFTRERTCTNPAPQNGGAKCAGKSFSIKHVVNGGWSNWRQWSKTRGDTFFTRKRTCTNPAPQNGGAKCMGKSIQIKKKIVNGGWSNWTQWSKTWGDTFFTRKRTCTNPAPQNGGAKCVGKSIEIKKEVVNGGWSNWGQWSKSGGNVFTRERTCTNPAPQNGGAKCAGKSFSVKHIVNGGWSNWGQWSYSVGLGVYTRDRTCTNPAPQNGGKECIGKSQEIKKKEVKPTVNNCIGTCSGPMQKYRGCASGQIGRLIDSIRCPSGKIMCNKCKCNVKAKWGGNPLIRQGIGELRPDGSCSCNKYCGYNQCRPDSAVIRIVCCGGGFNSGITERIGC